MLIFINEKTIDQFDLTHVTGLSREQLLAKVQEAAENNMVVSVNVERQTIHNAHTQDVNIFERMGGVPAEGHDEFRIDVEQVKDSTDDDDIVDAEIVDD